MASSIELAIVDSIINNIFRQDILMFIAVSFVIFLFIFIHLGLPQLALVVPIFAIMMIYAAWIQAIAVLLVFAFGILIAIFLYFFWTGVVR